MRILDYLFKKIKDISPEEIEKGYQGLTLDHQKRNSDELSAEIKRTNIQIAQAHRESDAYFMASQMIHSLKERARSFEKRKLYHEAISVYLVAIEQGIMNTRLRLSDYEQCIDRVIVLYGKTRQKDKLKAFLMEQISMYPDYRSIGYWKKRLLKLSNEQPGIELNPEDISMYEAGNPTLGKQIRDFRRSMPEFNFYFDLSDNSDPYNYPTILTSDQTVKLREYHDLYNNALNRARGAENSGDLKTAIEQYERLIAEEIEETKPYERLIVIYSRLKWTDHEKRILEQGIDFFTKLREQQLRYIYRLAKKYGMYEKAQLLVEQEKTIYYYSGAFELYNPQTNRVKRWTERLKTLRNRKEVVPGT